ncbi:MAG: flagellar biosynthesis protein FlgA [Rhodospirillaceae bacterium]|nr:flagellar biosynthesis protein FlgA [Rhodospirillaceae bacterium]HAA91101.1 flagellar biosynthesis protein FlgA [Rhodospirillaceae bacterium]
MLAIVRRMNVPNPIRVGLVGAGKFGSMFLSQVPSMPEVEVRAIAELDPSRAREACQRVGWDETTIEQVNFVTDAVALAGSDEIDVLVEATGDPEAAIRHALASFEGGHHVVNVTVEADALIGPLLAERAAAAGVVYSLAYGDQPALICELVDWARTCGFSVVAAGKGTKYVPGDHDANPDTVWTHYGLSPNRAAAAGMNPRMFTSFVDGTKSAIEMAAVANATGLSPAPDGLSFPPCPATRLQEVLKPSAEGGCLDHKGQVEVISSKEPDGTDVENNLRWGVYVVIEAPNDYTAACFEEYGLASEGGRYASMYKPFHLIGLELGFSVVRAARDGMATGCPSVFQADVAAVAKTDLAKGSVLDGEGGFSVWGNIQPAADSVAAGNLPIGLSHGVTLKRALAKGETVRWEDVEIDEEAEAVQLRREMEAAFLNRQTEAAE